MAEFTWKFSEREKKIGFPTSISMVFSRQGQTSISQGVGYPDITISSFDLFYKNWRGRLCRGVLLGRISGG